MKEEGKIFIITTGDYSDYSIDRVFSTKQKALEYLDTKDDRYTLEVYDIDEPIDRNTTIYCISFRLDKKKVYDVAIVGEEYKDLINIRHHLFNKINTLEIHVESDSRKRALKIASERYGYIIANEATMYPYLRIGLISHYGDRKPAYFDFHTGELVLIGNQELAIELPSFIKTKRLSIR